MKGVSRSLLLFLCFVGTVAESSSEKKDEVQVKEFLEGCAWTQTAQERLVATSSSERASQWKLFDELSPSAFYTRENRELANGSIDSHSIGFRATLKNPVEMWYAVGFEKARARLDRLQAQNDLRLSKREFAFHLLTHQALAPAKESLQAGFESFKSFNPSEILEQKQRESQMREFLSLYQSYLEIVVLSEVSSTFLKGCTRFDDVDWKQASLAGMKISEPEATSQSRDETRSPAKLCNLALEAGEKRDKAQRWAWLPRPVYSYGVDKNDGDSNWTSSWYVGLQMELDIGPLVGTKTGYESCLRRAAREQATFNAERARAGFIRSNFSSLFETRNTLVSRVRQHSHQIARGSSGNVETLKVLRNDLRELESLHRVLSEGLYD